MLIYIICIFHFAQFFLIFFSAYLFEIRKISKNLSTPISAPPSGFNAKNRRADKKIIKTVCLLDESSKTDKKADFDPVAQVEIHTSHTVPKNTHELRHITFQSDIIKIFSERCLFFCNNISKIELIRLFTKISDLCVLSFSFFEFDFCSKVRLS